MKNKFLTLIAITALLFTACKKGADVIPNPNGGTNSGVYQPNAIGSNWKYRNTTHDILNGGVAVDTTSITMSANDYLLSNKVYRAANSVTGTEKTKVYFGLNNGFYSTREDDPDTGEGFDMPYLNADAAVGANWTNTISIPGAVLPMQVKTTIVEKGISKNILNKTYTDVIHTQVEIQYKINNLYQSKLIYQFYAAKNIGLILIKVSTDKEELSTSELFSYTIK